MAQHNDLTKLYSLIKDIGFTMMTTAMSDGTLRSRPMATNTDDEPFNGTLWFFTDDHAAKVHEILQDTHVNLSYAEPARNIYVSVSGLATLVKDHAKATELWKPAYQAWFPQGLDDARLALIRVDVTQAEYWDSPGSKMVQLAGFVKSLVARRPAPGGEHQAIHVQQAQ